MKWYGDLEVSPLYLIEVPDNLKQLIKEGARKHGVSMTEFATRCLKLGYEAVETCVLDRGYKR